MKVTVSNCPNCAGTGWGQEFAMQDPNQPCPVCKGRDPGENMRKTFAKELIGVMRKKEDVFLLVGDLGYKVFDDLFSEFPNRCVNCGAAEQAMMDMAVGLAMDGKIPFVYSITPFLIYRPFETIRTYIDYEKLPVKLVASGRNRDYAHDGISHGADDVGLYLKNFFHIQQYWPKIPKEIPDMVWSMATSKKPSFISLER